MPGSVKRTLKNRTEWRSGYFRTYTSFAADINLFTDGPQASSNYVASAELHVLATTAGNIVVKRLDDQNVTLPCAVGWNVFPGEMKTIVSAGTTVVGTAIVYW